MKHNKQPAQKRMILGWNSDRGTGSSLDVSLIWEQSDRSNADLSFVGKISESSPYWCCSVNHHGVESQLPALHLCLIFFIADLWVGRRGRRDLKHFFSWFAIESFFDLQNPVAAISQTFIHFFRLRIFSAGSS